MTNYLENKLLDNVNRVGAAWQPPALYVALFTTDPTETGVAGTEVSTGGYSRKALTMAAAVNGSAVNNGSDITWTATGANYGTVTHVGIMDALTAGNMLWYKALTPSKIVNDSDQLKIAVGNLTLSMD